MPSGTSCLELLVQGSLERAVFFVDDHRGALTSKSFAKKKTYAIFHLPPYDFTKKNTCNFFCWGNLGVLAPETGYLDVKNKISETTLWTYSFI